MQTNLFRCLQSKPNLFTDALLSSRDSRVQKSSEGNLLQVEFHFDGRHVINSFTKHSGNKVRRLFLFFSLPRPHTSFSQMINSCFYLYEDNVTGFASIYKYSTSDSPLFASPGQLTDLIHLCSNAILTQIFCLYSKENGNKYQK